VENADRRRGHLEPDHPTDCHRRSGDLTCQPPTRRLHPQAGADRGWPCPRALLSLLVFDGQQTFILASDPFASGLDLLGTAGRSMNYSVVNTATIAAVQVSAIVLGHLAVGAQDRAVRLLPGNTTVGTQLPLVAAMVALTMGAIGLVLAPGLHRSGGQSQTSSRRVGWSRLRRDVGLAGWWALRSLRAGRRTPSR
jgi:hypothetical protein